LVYQIPNANFKDEPPNRGKVAHFSERFHKALREFKVAEGATHKLWAAR
jgi:hypothetical protein